MEAATNIVVVGVAHPQAAVAAGPAAVVTGDVGKVVAALPLAAVPPRVALHGVRGGEVVPRADEADGPDRGLGLSFGALAGGLDVVDGHSRGGDVKTADEGRSIREKGRWDIKLEARWICMGGGVWRGVGLDDTRRACKPHGARSKGVRVGLRQPLRRRRETPFPEGAGGGAGRAAARAREARQGRRGHMKGRR